MVFEAMFFDLDDTLYPSASGVWDAIGVRIEKYMQEKVHLPVDQIHTLRKDLWYQFGTTMRGLVELYQVDEEDYLEYVHDVDLSNYLQPDEALRQTLCLYPQRKLIFTNASKNHAQRVITRLGLDGIFDQIIDIQSIHPFCKPQKGAFEKAFHLQVRRQGDIPDFIPHDPVFVPPGQGRACASKAEDCKMDSFS